MREVGQWVGGLTSSWWRGTRPVTVPGAGADQRGRVRVDGTVVRRPAVVVPAAAVVEADTDHYVSRGAHKLAGALDDLHLAVPPLALDAGSLHRRLHQVLLLVKPQFEVGGERLSPGGVIREDHLRQAAVAAVAAAAENLGWAEQATVPSRVVGESGTSCCSAATMCPEPA